MRVHTLESERVECVYGLECCMRVDGLLGHRDASGRNEVRDDRQMRRINQCWGVKGSKGREKATEEGVRELVVLLPVREARVDEGEVVLVYAQGRVL